jgi:isoleucyl-tRNA synthetase
MATGKAHGLPVVNPIRPDGRFDEQVPLVGGMFFKDADAPLVSDLADRGLLFRSRPHEHSYPHCWRCGTPLLYYAQPSWYIRTTAIKEELLAENEKTNWQPPTIKHGRYGEWLRNNVDWAMSRTRYWGTPLPLWLCADEHVTCAGSLAELSALAGQDLADLDPHRPFVDDVVITCPKCGGEAHRVPEVIDTWYDSGSMPFAQVGAPLRKKAEFERAYPAQFIAEAIDQTRGWFYSLMAVGTLVFGRSAYENVLCLGLIADDRGRKMSKHLGNVLEPIPLMDAHGADALRWFFLASGSPWATRRDRAWRARGDRPQGPADVLEHGVLPRADAIPPLREMPRHPGRKAEAPDPAARPVLDRWVLGELHALMRDVTAGTWRPSTPPRPGGGSPRSSMTCPTGTSAGPGAAASGRDLAARPGRRPSPRCMSAWKR